MNEYSPPRLPMRLAPKRVSGWGGCLVRISDDARDCSVFLGFSSGDEFRPQGTGFFVGYPGGASRSLFLVTAAHVAKNLKDSPFAVRMNSDDGIARKVDIDRGDWIFLPNKNVDIAVLPFVCPDWAKKTVKSYPASEFLDPEREKYFDIGAGDTVQIVGLFHLKPLKEKNLPIVHTGHIALYPSDETLPMGRGKDRIDVSGYLVEISGLDGSSGSPAYVRPTVTFDTETHDAPKDTIKTHTSAFGRIYLLGVWVGAWPGIPDDVLKKEHGLSNQTMVPVGMGIVIPAVHITEILQLPEIQAMREKAIKKRDDALAARLLSLSAVPPAIDENPTHLEDFTSLLAAASKTPPQGD